jgi:LuxR family maltose regulon positive regulatory protein
VRPTKLLRPRPAADAVGRPRLLTLLDRGRACPLVLLTGPAGYGKTTLLGQWLAATARPAGWVTLDDRDDARGVLTHLVAALQPLLPGVGRATLGLLQLPGQVTPADLGATLADELAALDGAPDDGAPEVIVVLDDLQEVADPGVYVVLDALLRHPPPRVQLVLATRADPPLPLARLRARGQLLELRAADLRFTADEAAAFLHRASPGATPGAAAALAAGTEGWAAGLRLAAVALPRGATAAEVGEAFAGHRQALALEYLLDEVLARQPPAFQDALLRTAVPERLCAPLCDVLLAPRGPRGPRPSRASGGAPRPEGSRVEPAERATPEGVQQASDSGRGGNGGSPAELAPLLGDGAPLAPPGEAFLAALTRANLFLTRLDAPAASDAAPAAAAGAGAWYRYHPLFRELLLRQAGARLGPAALAAQHACAGAWFGAAGMVEEGVVHLLAAGDAGAAAALVEGRVGPAFGTDEWPALERWLGLLPPDVVERRPAALLARAWVAQRSGRFEAIPPLVGAAQALLDAPPAGAAAHAPEGRAALEAEGAALTAAARFAAGDPAGALAAAESALARPEAGPLARGQALVYAVLGTLAREGVDAAARRLDAATVAAGARPGDLELTGALIGLAGAQIQAGRLHEAEQTGRALLAHGEAGGAAHGRWWGHVFLGTVRYEWDDLAAAATHFRAALAERHGLPLLIWREAAIGLAQTLQAQGDPAAAGRALDGLANALVKTANTRQLAILAAVRADLALRRGDPAGAAGWRRAAEAARQPWPRLGATLAPLVRERAGLLGLLGAAGASGTPGDGPPGDGDPDGLVRLLAEAERLQADKRRVEVLTLLALARYAQGRPEAAFEALARAVELAQSGGLVRTFLDLGPPMVGLLRRLAVRRASSAYLARLLAAGGAAGAPVPLPAEVPAVAGPDPAPGPAPPPEPLTGRELEVLARLAQRWSNKEIAGELHITPETVKTHAAHVYAKLGVSGRRAAVRRAAELRLLALA